MHSTQRRPNKQLKEDYIDVVGDAGDACWVPPLLQSQQHHPQDKPPQEIKKKPKVKIKFKFTGKPKNEPKFKKGEIVEVTSDDEGYKGAWFVATIIDTLENERFLVEHRDLLMNDGGIEVLKEEIEAKFIRPCPPHVPMFGSLKRLQEVDAWCNDGWWEGMVVELVNSEECYVRFRNNEVLKFESSKLRPHQDWIDGKWIMSSKESSEPVRKFGDVIHETKNLAGTKLILKGPIPSESAKHNRDMISTIYNGSKFDLHFHKGANVEVKSDEQGYEGSWYPAIVVDLYQNGKYLVEYVTLKTDDLTQQLKEVVDVSDIRPRPPDIDHFCRYVRQEWVDAWYNDGWWEGVVSSVGHGLNGFKYEVYFWTSNEVLEFEHNHLRPHQYWIDGRWVLASLG